MATDQNDSGCTYEDITAMANKILTFTSSRPTVGIICGTGLSDLADMLDKPVTVPYEDIPGFPVSTVKGHHGKFVFGMIGKTEVLLMRGRFHYYEGYPMCKISIPVRVMKVIGIKTIIVTNAAGGLNPDYEEGDLMLLKDHLDLPGLTGECVLIGKNDERFGPRFIATNGIYDEELRKKFREIATEMGHGGLMREGVYVMIGGPTFTSVAESKFLHHLGADAVGMSTVPEAIAAKHCGMRVFALSLITDKVGIEEGKGSELTHEAVLKLANERTSVIQQLIVKLIDHV